MSSFQDDDYDQIAELPDRVIVDEQFYLEVPTLIGEEDIVVDEDTLAVDSEIGNLYIIIIYII